MDRLLHRVSSLCQLLLILAPVGAASAAPLVLNQTVPFDAAPAGRPDLVGPIIDESTTAFSFFDFCCAAEVRWTVSGSITSRVVRAADGTLDFYWQVTQHVESERGGEPPWGVAELRLYDFFDPALRYEAGWIEGSGGYWPGTASVYDGGFMPFPDHTVLMTIGGKDASQPSSWFFLDTDAHAYTRDATLQAWGQIWDHSGSNVVPTFAPVVPEPATWSLLLAGGVLMGWVRRSSRA
jgi:PEP-CTERM motif